MPIYEYRCPNGHLFERIHGFSELGPDVCDECGEGPVEKVLYPVAVHFKGSGFYATDYGRGARKRDGGKEGDTPSTDGSKPAEKAPEKPAEKKADA